MLLNEKRISVDLKEDGLLWLINRCVFHPRGFALGFSSDDNSFVLFGDGKEVWRFEDINEDVLFSNCEVILQRARCNNG